MKKLLLILVMLSWCNVGFAAEIYLKCTNSYNLKNSSIKITHVREYFFDNKKIELHKLSAKIFRKIGDNTSDISDPKLNWIINENVFKKYKNTETSYFFEDFKDFTLKKRSIDQVIEDNKKEGIKHPYRIIELNKYTLKLTTHNYDWKGWNQLVTGEEQDMNKIVYHSSDDNCEKIEKKF